MRTPTSHWQPPAKWQNPDTKGRAVSGGQLHTTAWAVNGMMEGPFTQTKTQLFPQSMRRWGPAAPGQGGHSGW